MKTKKYKLNNTCYLTIKIQETNTNYNIFANVFKGKNILCFGTTFKENTDIEIIKNWANEKIYLDKFEQNEITNNSSFYGCMFESCGNDFKYIQKIYEIQPKRIYTVYATTINDKKTKFEIENGFGKCNRIGYLVSKETGIKNEIFDTFTN